MKYWWILVLFFRCISGSIFNVRTGSEKVKVHAIEHEHSIVPILPHSFLLIKTLISFYAAGNHPLIGANFR